MGGEEAAEGSELVLSESLRREKVEGSRGGGEGGLEHWYIVDVAFPTAGGGGDGQVLAVKQGVDSSGLMRKPTGDA